MALEIFLIEAILAITSDGTGGWGGKIMPFDCGGAGGAPGGPAPGRICPVKGTTFEGCPGAGAGGGAPMGGFWPI